MDNTSRLAIGALSGRTNVKVVTIRYYEQIGLLQAPARTSGNYRAYGQAHVARLQFIRRCRDLGFTLDQVRDLLRLSQEESQDCGEVDRITAQHLREIEEKIADLTKLAGELRRLSSCCHGGRTIADCRIIEALLPGAAQRPGRNAPKRRRPPAAAASDGVGKGAGSSDGDSAPAKGRKHP